MEFTELIQERYSCRSFAAGQIATAQLTAILEAGRLAPTAKNLQEQRVYVVQSSDALAKLDAVCPCRYGAPTVLLVAFDRTNVFTYPGGKHSSGAEDASIVATHMLLAAKNAGVDSCWVNRFDPEELARALGLPDNEEPVLLLPLGYASENAKPHVNHTLRKELAATVSYV